MDIRWIKGTENEVDVFTKNLDGPAYVKCIKNLVGQDVYMKILSTSVQTLWARLTSFIKQDQLDPND